MGGFERVWEVLGFGRVWNGGRVWQGTAGAPNVWYSWPPAYLVQLGPRMSGTTGPPNGLRRIWERSKGFTRVWTVWEDFEGFGMGLEGLGSFEGGLERSGRVSEGLEGFGMVWGAFWEPKGDHNCFKI